MATSTMKLTAKMGGNFRTDVDCSHPVIIDQPIAAGGTDLGPNPLEYYLSGLVGCICAIGRIVAKQRKIELNGMEVTVEGDIDKAFLLGQTEKGRAGFTEFRINAKIDAPISQEEKEAFLQDVEKRCPVADNIQHATTVKVVVA